MYKLDVLLTSLFALCVHKLRINSVEGKGVLHSLEDYTIINSPKCTTQSQWSQKTGNLGPIIKYRSLSSLFLSKQTLCILEISTTLPFELLLFSRYQDWSLTKVDLVREADKMMAIHFLVPSEETMFLVLLSWLLCLWQISILWLRTRNSDIPRVEVW